MGSEISITTTNEMINDLLSTGGMYGMLNTIWLILCAMMFGGVMEATRLLHRVSSGIIQYAKTQALLLQLLHALAYFLMLLMIVFKHRCTW